MSRIPPFGDEVPALDCQRRRGKGLCGNPATRHIIWNDLLQNGLACDVCAAEAIVRWDPLQIHDRAPDCCMPGAHWFPEEATCRVPDEHVHEDELQEEREKELVSH